LCQGIEKKLNKEFKDQKIQNIHVDLNDKKVTFDADKVDQAKLGDLIKSAGYTLKAVDVKPAMAGEVAKDACLLDK
jgi:copper chaperone CopZ